MVVLHKISMIDRKLPRVNLYQNITQLAGAFTLQEYDPEVYEDQVKYFISMKYVHGLSCLGGVNMPDGRKVLLFYKEPEI